MSTGSVTVTAAASTSTPSTPVHRAKTGRSTLALLVLLALAIALVNPLGYIGGHGDDGRYLEAARAWAQHGPLIGPVHWWLRLPVVLPIAGVIALFGASWETMLLPGLLTWALLVTAIYLFSRRLLGPSVALFATLLLIAIPELRVSATRLTADLPEVLLETLSLGLAAMSFSRPRPHRWLLAAGVMAALAFTTRETALALGLIYAAAFATALGGHRWRWLWVLAGRLPLLVIEYAVYWSLTGDPLYRVHVDMAHVQIPQQNFVGLKAAKGTIPMLNTDIAGRWLGGWPVKLWWPLDPWINLFANTDYGYVFAGWAGLWLWAWRVRALRPGDNRLLRWLALCGAANMVSVVYVIATDPRPRMFMLAMVAAAVACGLLVTRLAASVRRVRWLWALAAAKVATLLFAIDQSTSYRHLLPTAQAVLARADGPVFTDKWTYNSFALYPGLPIRVGAPPVGGLWIGVGRPQDRYGVAAPPREMRWAEVVRADPPRVPVAAKLAVLARRFGVRVKASQWMRWRYPEPQAVLYRRVG